MKGDRLMRLTDREREAISGMRPGEIILDQPHNRRVLETLVRKQVLCHRDGGYACGLMWEKRER